VDEIENICGKRNLCTIEPIEKGLIRNNRAAPAIIEFDCSIDCSVSSVSERPR
jgi:hypothetical protein